MDNKYQRGKIYKLVSSQTDKIYIGSTIQTLKERKSKHKYSTKNKKNSSKFICCYDDFEIELIKEYPCNSKKELEREEGCIIKQNLDICVNKNIAGRTKKEHWCDVGKETNKKYRIENKEKYKKKRYIYLKNNRDKTNETHKKWKENNKEKVKQYNKNSSKKYRLENKEKIKKKKKEKYEYQKTWGGNLYQDNNLLKISLDLFI